jgi:hypothetical protein
MKGKTVFLLLVAFTLAGCAGGTSPTGTPAEAGTAAPASSEAALLTQTPTPSPEATQAPSATPAEPMPTTAPSATPTEPTSTTTPSVTPAEPTPTTAPSAAPTAMPQPTHTPTKPPSPTPAPPATATSTASPTAVAPCWEVSALLVGPGNPGRLYALQRKTESGAIDPLDVRLLVSDDYGQTWAPFPGELPAKECLHNVDMDYAQVDALYASTCEGLYRWSGNGWDLVSPQETTRVAVVYGQPQVLWAVRFPRAGHIIVRSNDGGVTWTPADADLIHFSGVATLGIDPTNADRLYAIINPKYAGTYLRRGNGNGQWEMMPTPNDNAVIDPGMTIDGPTGHLYVITSLRPYQLWRSRNPGADLPEIEWELLHDFGPDVVAHLLASGPGPTGPALYANLTSIRQLEEPFIETGPAVLHRSLDAGQTWSALPIPTSND